MMINSSKSIYNKYKTVINNFGFLMILQLSNYALPLIAEPYLIRTLGATNYGKVSFSQLLMSLLILFVNYGFDLTATRELAISKNDKSKRSRIFYSVMFAKFFILIIITLFFVVFVNKIEIFASERSLHVYYYMMVVGMFLFPVWFFQGMEDMKYITYFNISIRLISTFLIFVLIKQTNDYEMVAVIRGTSYVVIGFVAIIIAITKFHLREIVLDLNEIFSELKKGFHIFWSTIIVSFYRLMPAFIIGLFYNYDIVGYYNLVDKIVKMLIAGLEPIKRAVFPYFSQIFQSDKDKGLKQAIKISKFMAIFSLVVGLIMFTFAETIIVIFTGRIVPEAILLIRIFSVLPLIINLAGIFGTQIMINLGFNRNFSTIITIAGIISLVGLFAFVPIWGSVGAALVVVFTEFFILIAMFYVLKIKHIL